MNTAAKYKYTIKTRSPLYFTHPLINAVVIITIICIFLAVFQYSGTLFFILGIPALITYFAMTKASQAIVVTDDFFTLGETIIFYQALQTIEITENNHHCQFKLKSGESYTITAKGFPTNARKDWKILKKLRKLLLRWQKR